MPRHTLRLYGKIWYLIRCDSILLKAQGVSTLGVNRFIITLALILALVAGAFAEYWITPAIIEAGITTLAELDNICRALTRQYAFDSSAYMTAVSVAVGSIAIVMSLVMLVRARLNCRR